MHLKMSSKVFLWSYIVGNVGSPTAKQLQEDLSPNAYHKYRK